MRLTRRQVVQSALEHKPGRVPVDFGSTAVTGLHVTCVAALRDYYGLERWPVKVWEPFQMLGAVEDDLLEAMGVDTIGVVGPTTMFGFRNEEWREARMPWNQVVLVSKHFQTSPAPGGGLYLYPQGDRTAPPSGHMPAGGFFFDTIVRQPPLDEANLNPADNTEEFTPISSEDLQYFEREAAKASASGRSPVATFGGTAFGDIALVPAPFLKYPRGIRDVAEWYMATVTHRDYIHAVFARQCEIALSNLEKLHAVVGDAIDVVFVCGTDFGTQLGQFCSVETFNELYAPYYRRVNHWIHQHTKWRTFKHSCGAVEPFIEHFISCGFDILNPVQCSAAGMDPRSLKEKYGDRIVFWGGGVDTQKTLPFGTPADVHREVLSRCEIFSRNGGFVFNAVHNVQAPTPVENIVAMLDAVRDFNGN